MRVIRGSDGREWDVVVGRESWGSVLALFIPRSGEGEARQALLEGSSVDGAWRELVEMAEAELRVLLDRSVPKPSE